MSGNLEPYQVKDEIDKIRALVDGDGCCNPTGLADAALDTQEVEYPSWGT